MLWTAGTTSIKPNMSTNKGRDFFANKVATATKIYALAPLAGFSDIGMRALCLRYGADYTVTEMVSAKGLIYGNANTEILLETAPEESLKCVQLFGREPDVIFRAIRLPLLQKFDVIDFNFGCPMKKIVSNGEGSALMKEPDTVYKIIKAAVEAADGRAVTAKLRAGYSEDNKNAPEVAKAVQEAGGTAVTVHGRTRDEFYGGVSDKEIIKKVKDAVKIPVIANGDVVDKKSADDLLAYTGADGVAVGRGAVGRPYIFSELKGETPLFDRKELILSHLDSLLSVMSEKTAVNNLKKHIVSYIKGLRGAANMRLEVMSAVSADDIRRFVDYLPE